MKTRAETLSTEQQEFIRKVALRPMNWGRTRESTTEHLQALFLKGEEVTTAEIKDALETLVPQDSRLEFLELCHPLVSSTKGFTSLAKLLPKEQKQELAALKQDDPAYHRYLKLKEASEQRTQNYVSPVSSSHSSLFTPRHCEPAIASSESKQIKLK